MKATLIYNHNARLAPTVSAGQLQRALREAGYRPVYTPTIREEDLDSALADADGGLVLAAGGDGTVRAVATRLLDREVALSVLPLGTANNIARTLGVEGEPDALVRALADPCKRDFDVGLVKTPWARRIFLEAMGFGFYADTLAAYRPKEPKSVLRAISAFTQTLPDYRARRFRIRLDGQDLSGDYLLVEVLNTTAFGPRLTVAPAADVADGLFEVLRIRQQERESFVGYIVSLFAAELADLPSVETSQGRRLEVKWTGFPLHIDGEVHPPADVELRPVPENDLRVTVEVLPQVLEFWLPKQRDTGNTSL